MYVIYVYIYINTYAIYMYSIYDFNICVFKLKGYSRMGLRDLSIYAQILSIFSTLRTVVNELSVSPNKSLLKLVLKITSFCYFVISFSF